MAAIITGGPARQREARDIPVPLGGMGWIEYAARDVPRIRDFFTGLFGWSVRVKEFAHEGVYVTFTLAGDDVAGLLSARGLTGGAGATGWSPVMRVADVDCTAAKAAEIGASVVIAPNGITGLGRHAMVAGPSQGRMSLLDMLDVRAARSRGCVGWTDIRATNPAATALFLWKLLGWESETLMHEGEEFITVFSLGGRRMASLRRAAPGEASRSLPCIEVGDIAASLCRARDLGGAVLEERASDPVLGCMARLADPLGVDFIVYRPE